MTLIIKNMNLQADVIEDCMVDRLTDCPWDDLHTVLMDWDNIMQKAEEISKDIGVKFFSDNPQITALFPSLQNLEEKNLVEHKDFLTHSRAVLRGLNSVMLNLSGKYEEENEILPVISETHVKRGVDCFLMLRLKEAVLQSCSEILNLPPKSRTSLKTKTKTENHFKKLLHAKKSNRRSSLAEVRETNAVLKNSQVTSPITLFRKQSLNTTASPTPSDRRPSRAFLHPDHAKLMVKRSSLLTPPSQRFSLSFEDSQSTQNGLQSSPLSSSAASSVTSISNAPVLESQHSDTLQNYESRKSSTTTNKYSILDAHDLEYSLIKTARGSLGPCSLSQSLQRLTFTQSLAFPELAKGASNKRKASRNNTRNKLNPLDSGVNAFAKVTTALLLVLISVLVFGMLYKFIRT